ncbi:MAG: hypothetical protein HYY37_05920 [Candidatus Aenigmarchaeota archaeon]|nr:hypothetical protein [Candidatus Aenigmarchaeota archaeon]
MNKTLFITVAALFLLNASVSFALDVFETTNKYTYTVNESIYVTVSTLENSTAISNQSVAFTVKNSTGSGIATTTLTTNATGGANYTFSLTATGNYTIEANASGTVVSHFIKVLSYSTILVALDKPSYTPGANGTFTTTALDANNNAVAGVVISPKVRYQNGTLISTPSSCTTGSAGTCSITFGVPETEGEYILELNNYEAVVSLLVGGFSVSMKVSPTVVGKNVNVTVRVSVKNTNGNGITASTRQLVITAPNGTKTTISPMTQAADSGGTSITGVYENTFNSDLEGAYSVVATITPQGSNITKELFGSFDVRSYLLEIGPWEGQTVFYPGSTVSLGLKLKNASTGDNIAGKALTLASNAKVLDPSNVDTGITPTITDRVAADGRYRIDFTISSAYASGTYKLKLSINDSFGSGSATGYFSIQRAKGTMVSLDKFPDGLPVRDYIAGKSIVLRFSAQNSSGTVPVTAISSFTITDKSGADKTLLFGTPANYTSGNYTYLNLTAPKNGGDYSVSAKVSTPLGETSVGGVFFVKSLDVSIRPVSAGGGGGPGGASGPSFGPGFFWFFRPNDTVQLNVSVTTASESQGDGGFMTKGSFGGGPQNIEGGLFGIGGGSAVQGAQVTVTKVINVNTEEDWTSSITLTNCVTNSAGNCALSMKSNVNGQNWTGGFFIAFVNVSTSDNKTDDAEGFFEVRRFFMDVLAQANTTNTASSFGFQSFGSWNVGPTTGVNVSVTIREPGIWQTISQGANITVLGVFYGGNAGEFIFPPKKIEGTNRSFETTSGTGSVVIPAPSTGWKSGFYIVQVQVNVSGQIDTGQGFMMSKVFEGFGRPVNPTTLQDDFTVGSNENVSLRVDVFDVVNFRPAANLTVTFSKILSFAQFPPGELSYDRSVSQGTTAADGGVLMSLAPPTGGWGNGQYLAVFSVTNGTHSDSVEGFFMVRNFFAELSTGQWRYGKTDTVTFNVTISSDPSWMRQRFGGGCPAGDPSCQQGSSGGGGGGPPPGGPGGGPQSILELRTFDLGIGHDVNGDMVKDINITIANQTTGAVNLSALANASIAFMGCINASWSDCADSEKVLPEYNPFSFSCSGTGFMPLSGWRSATNTTATGTYNATGARFYCLNTTSNTQYKLSMRGPGDTGGGNPTNWSVEYIQDLSATGGGGVGGSTGLTVNANQGFSYFNATLRSVRVVRHNFQSGTQTALAEITNYNVTSADGTIKGTGNIVIPGTGSFKLVPTTSGGWSTGDYQVIASFNTSSGTEDAQWGFSVETFFASCNRLAWGQLQSGMQVNVSCSATNPSSNQQYAGSVEWQVESVTNSMTGAAVSSSSWAAAKQYGTPATIVLNQSLSNGFYQAVIKVNESSDIKRSYIWFDVKDFDAFAWAQRWNYGSGENVTINAEGRVNNQPQRINVSNSTGSAEVVVYRYDKATWTKSAVSGVTVVADNSTDFNGGPARLRINLSRSGNWQEGMYEVTTNLSRVDINGIRSGGSVEVRSWFDVRLFDVWAWSERWSNHPNNNVTLKVFVGAPGGGGYYNGQVTVEVVSVENMQNGTLLVNGTHYRNVGLTGNPSNAGNMDANLTPLGSGLPTGQYRAKLKVTDASGNAAYADATFEVVSFYIQAFTDRYEYTAGENVTIQLSVYNPSGSPVTLSNARITQMGSCTSSSCSSVNVSTLNYAFNATTLRLQLNTSGLSQGQYWMNVQANDTQNAVASVGIGIKIASFAVSGTMLQPAGSSNGTYRDYYINETMMLNVSGTSGVNITNATFTYYDCDYTCVSRSFVITIGRTLASSNEIINLTPPGANSTWYTSQWGSAYYTVDVRGTSSGSQSQFGTYAYVVFPWVSNVNGLADIAPNGNISSELRVFTDFDRTVPRGGANVSLRRVRNYNTWQDVNTTVSNWLLVSSITNSTGHGNVSIAPAGSFVWPTGQLWIEYIITYGNASTGGGRYITVSQKNLRIEGKTIHAANDSTIVYVSGSQRLRSVSGNRTNQTNINLSLSFSNPSSSSVSANVTITRAQHATNSSAIANNLTSLVYTNAAVGTSGIVMLNWTMNVTQAGNWTGTITVVPASTLMSTLSTTYSFESV